MPKNYIHKPSEVQAIQLTPESFDACVEFVGAGNTTEQTSKDKCFIELSNDEGLRDIYTGDYIIMGVLGKVYPCSAEVFEASYYEVKE